MLHGTAMTWMSDLVTSAGADPTSLAVLLGPVANVAAGFVVVVLGMLVATMLNDRRRAGLALVGIAPAPIRRRRDPLRPAA